MVALAGHSSGAVVALEALAAEPGVFAGAVLYEPPVATGPPDPQFANQKAPAEVSQVIEDLARRVLPLSRWQAGRALGSR